MALRCVCYVGVAILARTLFWKCTTVVGTHVFVGTFSGPLCRYFALGFWDMFGTVRVLEKDLGMQCALWSAHKTQNPVCVCVCISNWGWRMRRWTGPILEWLTDNALYNLTCSPIFFILFLFSLSPTLQLMAAGASGASGHCVVRAARGSAAETAQPRSPNMEDDCVTGWHWWRTTAPAASAQRVGDIITLWHKDKQIVHHHYCLFSSASKQMVMNQQFSIGGIDLEFDYYPANLPHVLHTVHSAAGDACTEKKNNSCNIVT